MAENLDTPSISKEQAEQISKWMIETGWMTQFQPGQIVKWSFGTSLNIENVPETHRNIFDPEAVNKFTAFSAREKEAAIEAFSLLASVANIKFEFVNDPAQADLRLGYAAFASDGGYCLPTDIIGPSGKNVQYVLVDDEARHSIGDLGGFGYMTLLHEIGHAIGLAHPDTPAGGPFPGDVANTSVSMMAYTSYPQHQGSYLISPMILDILALQKIYGKSTVGGAENNTEYALTPEATSNQNKLTTIYKGQIKTIFDDSGVNTLNGSKYSDADIGGREYVLTLDLREGHLSSVGAVDNLAIAFGSKFHNAVGSSGTDLIIGNDLANKITGGKGRDVLKGNEGLDIYRFTAGDGIDTIQDEGGLIERRLSANSDYSKLKKGIYQSEGKWRAEDGTLYERTGNDLTITFGAGSEDKLVLKDFNFDVAQTRDLSGIGRMESYGVELTPRQQAVLANSVDSQKNPARAITGLAENISTSLKENTSRIFKLWLSEATNTSRKIVLNLTGVDVSKFALSTGTDQFSFSNGKVELTLAAGETSFTFALLNSSDTDNSGTLNLRATVVAPTGSGLEDIVSNFANIDYTAKVEDESTPIKVITDDQENTRTFNSGKNSDVLRIQTGYEDRAKFIMGAGNDLIAHAVSGDEIYAGDGNDAVGLFNGNELIAGGEQLIYGGAGNDWLTQGGSAGKIYGESGNDVLGHISVGTYASPVSYDRSDIHWSNWDVYWQAIGSTYDVVFEKGIYSLNDSVARFEGGSWFTDERGNLVLLPTDKFSSTGGSFQAADGTQYTFNYVADSSTNGTLQLFWVEGGNSKQATIQMSSTRDQLAASTDSTLLDGGEGDDLLVAGTAGSILIGGQGSDLIQGGDGQDSAYGDGSPFNGLSQVGAGNDQIALGGGDDYADGGDGDDIIIGEDGKDVLFGGRGNDVLSAGKWDLTSPDVGEGDYLAGEDGDDRLFGSSGRDILIGGNGHDWIQGEGNDVGVYGDDFLSGDAGNDTLLGSGGKDTLYGGEGNDILLGDADGLAENKHGNDILYGEAGDDELYGGGGEDYVFGGIGNDLLSGGKGDDILDGGDGDDNVYGDEGDDTIYGGLGQDVHLGGAGADTYQFELGDSLVEAGIYDAIIDTEGANIVRFGPGISIDDIGFQIDASGQYLVVNYSGEDFFIIDGGLSGNVAQFEFADGSRYSYVELIARTSDSTLSATDAGGGAIALGGKNSETVSSLVGGSTLSGGKGNDHLIGNGGNNTYLYSSGFGADRITDTSAKLDADGNPVLNRLRFGEGISSGDVSLISRAGELVLRIAGVSGDEIVIEGFDPNNVTAVHPIDVFEFDDGTVLSFGQLLEKGFDFSGTDGIDMLVGTNLDDFLDGGAGNDVLQGGEGSDTYYWDLGRGQDIINNADSGEVDILVLGPELNTENIKLARGGNDLVITVAGYGDKLTITDHFSTAEINSIQFSDGTVWDGADVVAHVVNELTDGNDAYTGTEQGETINSLAGSDTVNGMGGNDVIDGGSGGDTLRGGNDDDTIFGGAGSDQIYGDAGSDLLNGGDDNDILYGGIGNDTLSGGQGTNWLYGEAGSDTLVGGSGVDYLYGGLGDDVLDGDDGNDSYYDDQGSDTFVIRHYAGTDYIYGSNDPVTNGTTDKVVFADLAYVNDLFSHVGNELQIRYGGHPTYVYLPNYFLNNGQYAIDEIWFKGGTVFKYDDLVSMFLNGDEDVDYLTGFNTDDVMSGNGGDDQINGGAGKDTLIGGAGNDSLFGGTGGDTYRFSRGDGLDTVTEGTGIASDIDVIELAADITPSDVLLYQVGQDLVIVVGQGEAQLSVSRHFDGGLYAIDRILFADTTTWSALDINSRLVTGVANAMTGMVGNDVFTVDSTGDTIAEAVNQGIDTINSNVTFALPENVENLNLTGVLRANGYGNVLNNILHGNASANTLWGGNSGTDYLYGESGNDTMGASGYFYVLNQGYDYFYGGLGDDIYYADGGEVIEFVGEGTDSVYVTGSYTLGDNVENLYCTNVVSGGDVFLNGNAENNIIQAWANQAGAFLDGKAGADTMYGSWDNVFYVDNVGDRAYGTGKIVSSIDWVMHSSGSPNTVQLDDNPLARNLTGNAGANILIGNGYTNIIYGMAGNDTLIGSGDDSLYGGEGNDTYYIDGRRPLMYDYEASAIFPTLPYKSQYDIFSPPVSIVELAGEGTDRIVSIYDYVLTENIENLTLGEYRDSTYGTILGPKTGTGNRLDNHLLGNRVDNVLDGKEGNDLLEGGAGLDRYKFSSGSGQDTIVDYHGTADNVFFSKEISQEQIWFRRVGNDLEVSLIGTADLVLVKDWYTNSSWQIEKFYIAGHSVLSAAGVEALVTAMAAFEPPPMGQTSLPADYLAALSGIVSSNWAPLQNNPPSTSEVYLTSGNWAPPLSVGERAYVYSYIFDQDGLGDLRFQWQISSNATDWEDIPGATYSSIESMPPEWVGFYLRPIVTYTDQMGFEEVIKGAASAQVLPPNRSPVLEAEIPELGIAEGLAFSYAIPASTFSDPDVGDSLTYYVTLFGGESLPSWLSFDSITGTFSGTPPNNAEGIYELSVRAYDRGMKQVETTMTITVMNRIAGNSSANVLTGTASAEVIDALGGNDTLDGLAGADTLIGGSGNDTYVLSVDIDAIVESLNGGTDLVQSAFSYELGSNVENLTLTGSGDTNATGNALVNALTGNGGNNILDGGAGADTMTGGTGNDTYIVDNSSDVVTEGSSGGIDLVLSSVSHTLGSNVENLTLTSSGNINATGNTLANVLVGNAGSNTLNGGTGNDNMSGGLGDDIYVVDATGDVVTEVDGGGTDTIQSSVALTLGSHVENLTLTGTSAINGTGNSLDNILTGNSGNNMLTGGAGNDTLNGGAGTDNMSGGTGDDIYIVDATGDVVTENTNEGIDTVQSSATLTLGNNVENLTLTGSAAINASGNSLGNILTGNSGNNTLTGGAGADTLTGGSGNDTYVMSVDIDTIVESSGGGTDLVQSAFSYALGDNLENLTLTGTTAINGTGNALVNVLTGNSGNNILDGGAGADTMAGGTGNDTYIVDNTGDVVTEGSSAGTDLVLSSVSHTLGSNVENLTLTGSGNINATGNTSANVLVGNAGHNTLNGGTGNDNMSGGLGDDIYVVNATGDVVTENAGEGTDTIQSSVTLTLGNNVENLTLTGTSAINGTGNSLDNILNGNSGNNTLSGGAGNDTLNGGAGTDTLVGGLGDDTYIKDSTSDTFTEQTGQGTDTVQSSVTYTLGNNLENVLLTGSTAINATGNTLNNVLTGNSGNNTLSAAAGNDTLDGGAGTDILNGGTGNDIYILGRGYGSDTVQDSDATAGNTDVASFLSGIATDQLWFRHVGSNLEVSIIGTSDKFTIQNWYSGVANRVEEFRTADGHFLLDDQVENLVQAMAAFAPPAAGQTTLPQSYQDQLAPVIAANWQ